MRQNLKGVTCLHVAAGEGHVTVTQVSHCHPRKCVYACACPVCTPKYLHPRALATYMQVKNVIVVCLCSVNWCGIKVLRVPWVVWWGGGLGRR